MILGVGPLNLGIPLGPKLFSIKTKIVLEYKIIK